MIQTKQIGSKTIIYTDQMGGGTTTYITESYPTNFHTFATSVILNNPADIEKYKEVTESQRKAIEESDAAWVEPPQVFIDLAKRLNNESLSMNYVPTIGKTLTYNEKTGYFELNGLTDITTIEMMEIVKLHVSNTDGLAYSYRGTSIRTNIHNNWCTMKNLPASSFYDCKLLEVTVLVGVMINNGDEFTNCNKLREVHCSNNTRGGTVIQSPVLESVSFSFDSNANKNCSFPKSPVLKFACLSNAIASSVYQNTAKSITLHPDVYAALMGEAEYPFNGGTREEWSQVFQQAQEKNITFASA